MNQQISESDFLRIKALYTAKYGQEMDDWTAIILCEIEDHFKGLNKSLNVSIKEIQQAATFIKGQVKPIYFSSEEQAYKYGLTSRLYPFLTVVIGILVMWFIYCFFSLNKNEKANLKLFNNIIKNGPLITEQGEVKIVLKAKRKGDNVFGTYFEYDPKTDQLTVPLKTIKDN